MTAVLANGPVTFTDDKGSQMAIPLPDLYFDATNIKADKWPPYKDSASQAFKDSVDAWLQYLVRNGELVKDTQAVTGDAMLITAKSPGATGNSIKIVISNIRDDANVPPNKIFDVTVTETDSYSGLTPATIKDVIGTAAGTGTKPGLVFVSSAAAPALPVAGDSPLAGAPAKVKLKQADASTAFEVQAKDADADGANTVVTIKNIAGQSFDMVVVWNKTKTGIKASEMQTNFGYELAVAAPPSGTTILTPAPGAIVLSGGADAQGPTKASVIVPANP